ncbi:hypothetical protein HC766_05175 [Candidatus Gracilibacteria bacterium]|nr:hypothetical protein [Candidatus Gracilibacteria bacterium]
MSGNFSPPCQTFFILIKELKNFFDYQDVLDGLTRIYCEGIWRGESELSVTVIVFNVTLREVVTFGYDYMEVLLYGGV